MKPLAQPHAQPGGVLFDKYRVEDVIGIGGMGCVVRATHLQLHQPVAIKILLPTLVENTATVQRFLREAQATVRLRSEHIARIMDVATLADGTPTIVMEFLDGYDLNQILRHHGPQMTEAVVDLMIQACEGIAEAHSLGIIHRDLKPSNFFVTRRPDGSSLLKILDFGISKAKDDDLTGLTGSQTVVGTPMYMAPEQMKTARSGDPRSDVWSLGVVLYQMLTGRPPFDAETYAQLVLKVVKEAPSPLATPLPDGLEAVMLRCLEKEPDDRIQNVGELARLLAPYASDPRNAQQAAERATRILTVRNTSPGFKMPAGQSHDAVPPMLTTHAWSQAGTSLGGSSGQVTARPMPQRGRGRGMVIAIVAAVCVVVGAGGYALTGSPRSDSHGEANAAAPIAPAAELPAEPAAPAAPVPEPEMPVATPAVATTAKPITPAPTPMAAKSPPKPATTTPAPHPKRPVAPPTPPKKPDDLFNDRH